MVTNPNRRLSCFFSFSHSVSLFFVVLVLFSSCQNENTNEEEIENLSVAISFERFDLKFYNQPPDIIPKLKVEYPFLFPKQFSDSVWIKRQKDSLQLLLYHAVSEEFKDVDVLENQVSHLFKHIKYHVPTINIPRVITLTNNVDYQLKTVYSDSLLLLSLDTFLGSNHPFYEGIPNYIRKELDRKYIPSQIVEKLSSTLIPAPEGRTFLAQMIYEGKKLYLQDLFLPHEKEEVKIAYTSEELEWAKENELYVWQYFIENQSLYQTDPDWVERFLKPAPFSKFYLQLDNESPGKIGRWIGWQIVKSHRDQYPEVPLREWLALPAQQLFNQSKYKPNR